MQTAADMMTKNILTCKDTDSLLEGHNLMRTQNIRHIPIVSEEDGRFVGLLSYKEVLKKAFEITDAHGTHKLDRYESKVKIQDVMNRKADVISPGIAITEAGEFFLNSKQGCLAVCEQHQIVGIITSTDFVKLSMRLLKGE